MLGPLVSFRGSPTVSPTTAALWMSDPFPTRIPSLDIRCSPSMYFLALSHAPPELAAEMASWTPEMMAPGRKPATALGPNANPIIIGVKTT